MKEKDLVDAGLRPAGNTTTFFDSPVLDLIGEGGGSDLFSLSLPRRGVKGEVVLRITFIEFPLAFALPIRV